MSTPKSTPNEEPGLFVWCTVHHRYEFVSPTWLLRDWQRPLTLPEYLSMPINIRHKLEKQHKQRLLSST